MYACKRENMLKCVSSGKFSESYNEIFNSECLFLLQSDPLSISVLKLVETDV